MIPKKAGNHKERGCEMDIMKFKGFCAEHGIRQKEIAELLGIDKSNVNLKMNNKQPFTLEQVKILCDTYHISADDFFL